jgi:hypothetical protein
VQKNCVLGAYEAALRYSQGELPSNNLLLPVPLRFEAIYGNIREANRGSAVSTEASLEQAGSKQRETDL